MLCAAALLCALAPAQQPEQPTPSPQDDTTDVLATVDGRTITADELWWYVENTAGGRVLDEMIVRELIMRTADQQGLKVGTPEVDEALARIVEQHDSPEAFERWLAESGQTEKGLRIALQQQLLLDKLLREHIGLTEDGIRRYYDSHPAEFTVAPRVYLLDIVTRTIHDAYAARERLAAGEDFASLAREVSQDPTAARGGDRGWIEPDDVLCATVAAVIFRLSQGEISDPVECGDHAHVLLAQEVEPAIVIPFEEAREQVVERIQEVRGISEELYIALLKRRAEIDVAWSAADYLNDVYADLRAIKLVVDGRRVQLQAPPRLLPNSNLILPVVPMLDAMGAAVEWNADAGVLEASRDGIRLRMVLGATLIAAGDEELPVKEPLALVDGVLMISPRGPVEALGGSVLWNRTENTLYVSSWAEQDADAETVQ